MSTSTLHMADTKREIDHCLFRVIVRQAFPTAKVSTIGHTTLRVTYYEPAGAGWVQTNRIRESFLVSVVPSEDGPVVVRLPVAPSQRVVRDSDRW